MFAGLIFLANVSESTPDLIAFEVTCEVPKLIFAFLIICCLSLLKPHLIRKSVQYRKLSNVNISALKEDLRSSSLFSQTHSSLIFYNDTLAKIIVYANGYN